MMHGAINVISEDYDTFRFYKPYSVLGVTLNAFGKKFSKLYC